MKLSEAIRAGTPLRPQGFGNYVTFEPGQRACTCALGAAYEALFHQLPPTIEASGVIGDINKACGLEFRTYVTVPAGAVVDDKDDAWWHQEPRILTDIVARLNDYTRWTREQIADWLAGEGF